MQDKAAQPRLFTPVEIDPTKVEFFGDNLDLFAFEVVLSGPPDPDWKACFEELWKISHHPHKLGAEIRGNHLRCVCRKQSPLPVYLQLVEGRIRACNRLMGAWWRAQGMTAKPETWKPYGKGYRKLDSLRAIADQAQLPNRD